MNPTILVSDDEEEIGTALRRAFRSRGVDVLIDTRADAPQLAAALQPSAILLDLLQGEDGLALLQKLKADEATRHIPVVVMSGLFDPAVPAETLLPGAMALGAFAVVSKPFPDDFVDRFAALARSARELFAPPAVAS